ncbi:MAG: HD domain-containing protein [Chloroflexi bacterium]|nr:HD domain-containing protein [Chloroflexota bacterium]
MNLEEIPNLKTVLANAISSNRNPMYSQSWLEKQEWEVGGHLESVIALTLSLASAVGFPEEDFGNLRLGVILHDIGKVAIPKKIWDKTTELTEKELDTIRQHPVYSFELLSQICSRKEILDIAQYHHEKWDGKGYPRRLKKDNIPLAARIFSIVDVWDALISDRPFRKARSKEEALKFITDQAGRYFDPQIVEEFIKLSPLEISYQTAVN